jgi:hypothetical protein
MMLRQFALTVALGTLATAAIAEGFATRDLTTVTVDQAAFPPLDWLARAEPDRLTLMCTTCAGLVAVDILIGRQDDGTEGRIRSGETTMADMEAVCQANDAACRLTGLDVGPAVGWQTVWPRGSGFGSTVIAIRDGDLLTVRAVADTAAVAEQVAADALAAVGLSVIGD